MSEADSVPEPEKNPSTVMSFCRRCGGDRHHSVLFGREDYWSEDDSPVCGSDAWEVLRCGGCHTVTFRHRHWFSEEYDHDPDGTPSPVVHNDLYPPAPRRKPPEWKMELFLGLKMDEIWIVSLLDDIYTATGVQARSLAAMGVRSIVDHLVTTRGGDNGAFLKDLDALEKTGIISPMHVALASAVFDAGSAAVHRGYNPTEENLGNLLDVTESLLFEMVVRPVKAKQDVLKAGQLQASTPQRKPRSGPG